MNKTANKKIIINPANILFLALIITYCLTTSQEIGGDNSKIKYLVLCLCILERFFKWNKTKNSLFKKEYKKIGIFIIVLTIYSLIRTLGTFYFSFRPIQEIFFLVAPLIYCYFLINTLTKDEIYNNMKWGFIISFIFYIISLGMNFNSIIASLFSASFINSTSNLESSIYCGYSLAFCAFFNYFDKNKILKYLSLLFVFMTFKRLFIVMSIVFYILSHTKLKNKPVPPKTILFIFFSLIIFSVVYYNCMIPSNVTIIENRFNIDISKLTSTRSDRLEALVNSNYKSYGFGSSTEYMYKYFYGALEMDIIKIFVELGFLPAILLIYSYINLSKQKYYSLIFMSFLILNLIFSSALTGTISWILFLLTILSIQTNIKENEND